MRTSLLFALDSTICPFPVSHPIADRNAIVQRLFRDSVDSSSDFGDIDEGDSDSMEMNYRIENEAPGRLWRASARIFETAG